jgi:hypothetical protein
MWNPFRRNHLTLHSPLDRETCRRRLQEITGSIWNPFSRWTHPLRGQVNDRGFWILKTLRYRNSFQTEARGRWSSEGTGTRIELSLGMNRLSVVALIFALVVVGAVTSRFGFTPTAEVSTLLVRAIPVLMLILGAALVAFGRWLSRRESDELIALLSRTLGCQPTPTPIS